MVLVIDRLEEAGVTPESFGSESDFDFSALGLSEDEGNDMDDSFEECVVDIREDLVGDVFAVFAECPGAAPG